MAMMAGGVQLDPELMKILGEIRKPQSENISSSYSRLRGTLPQGSTYATERFDKLGGLSQGGLKTNLESVLGNTSYGDWKNERDYQHNVALAERIGGLMAPSVLQQVLGGLSGAAQAGGDIYGAYSNFSKRPQKKAGPGISSSYDLYDSALV